MGMCEKLKALIQSRILPLMQEEMARQSGQKADDLTRARESFEEMLADMAEGLMDEWECGELHDEFVRYLQSGDFLDKIS
ncbi:MAG: hypothetical protein GXO33_08450 [Epsilonproteobacteria bacterium]|nr:hypothetical protein [Campylobacterota bacterium]